MTRKEILTKILGALRDEFEIKDPGLDNSLADYGFDSIDALELLEYLDEILGTPMSHEEKKAAMEIRTINQIVDYVESLMKARQA